MKVNTKDYNWSPLYFLSALGAGGMAVTFFMYLMFWIPHPGQPVPVVADWLAAFSTGGIATQVSIIIALLGIAFFVARHLQLLAWNFIHYREFRASGGEQAIVGTNAHTQLMAMPLTVAMTINTLFIVGLVFVPGLWSVVEYLFPAAMTAFMLIGIWAMRIYLSFFGETLSKGSFNKDANNSLAQMLPAFALAMVGVGLAAPAAMSHNTTVVGIATVLSMFFIAAAALIGAVNLVLGLGRLFDQGASLGTLPTLWIGIPVLTVIGIALVRMQHGAHTLHLSDAQPFTLITVLFVVQLLFALMGWAVMSRMQYFAKLLRGDEHSPAAFSLICPGVALVVMGHFFVNKALVAAGIIEKFGPTWLALVAALLVLQFATGWFLLRLVKDIKPEQPVGDPTSSVA